MGVALLVAAGLVVGVGALVWAVQRPMLYLAGGTVPSSPPEGIDPVTFTTDDGLVLEAWWLPAAEPRAAALAFPGNAGTRAQREPLARMLADAGVSTLLVEYRGYADNPGRPSEPGLRADARAARSWLDDVSADGQPVLYVGESLGAAVAAGLASERPPDALLLRSPFPSLADAAAAAYGLPAVPGPILRDRYPVAEHVAELDDVPIAVVAGEDDQIVPPSLSARVAEAAGVSLRMVDGASHNDPAWLDGPGMRQTVEKLLDAATAR